MVIIRSVVIADALYLLPLMEQLGYPQTEDSMTAILDNYLNTLLHEVLIAEKAHKIVGLICIAGLQSFVYKGISFRITAMVVDKDVRGLGIGKLLMLKAEEFAKENGGKVIDLTSGLRRAKDGSHKFYNSLGFNNDGHMAKLYLRKEIK